MDERRDVRALAIDDDEEGRTTLERLGRYGVECIATPPPRADTFPEEIIGRIERKQIDVVLLDFQLDDQSQPGEHPVSYRGGMLAAAIKEKLPTPIVLVTTEEKLSEFVADNPRIRSLFDHQLLKSQLSGSHEERKKAAAEIKDLATGFRRIRQALDSTGDAKKSRAAARALLDIDQEELTRLEERLQAPVPLKPVEFASWLLQGLLIYPGPLLDAGEARSRLGLSERAFANENVQDWADEARYKGVFGELHRRWWEGQLLICLQRAAGDRSFGNAQNRAEAIAKECGERDLPAAQCTWCEKGLVQRTCHVCRKAVDTTHNLAARVDERPTWALPAIVCFRCIETGRAENIPCIRYGPGSIQLIDELKELA